MTIRLNFKAYCPSSSHISTPVGLFVNLLRRTSVVVLFVSLIWLTGLPMSSALASSTASAVVAVPVQSERLNALISCLPRQLSQPDLKRTWSEMGNDQLERILNLKPDFKRSQAETELASCLSRQGFAPQG